MDSGMIDAYHCSANNHYGKGLSGLYSKPPALPARLNRGARRAAVQCNVQLRVKSAAQLATRKAAHSLVTLTQKRLKLTRHRQHALMPRVTLRHEIHAVTVMGC